MNDPTNSGGNGLKLFKPAAASLLLMLALTFVGPMAGAQVSSTTYSFDLPAQPLAEALRTVGHQTSTNVMFEPRLVKNLRAPALRTQTTATEAIRLLLAGTQLTAVQTAPDSILIESADTAAKTSAAAVEPASMQLASNAGNKNNSASAAQAAGDQEEIVVTGSHIQGVQPSSPLLTITQEEMRLSGHNNLGEVIRALPQNFSGGQNPGVIAGPASGAAQANTNVTGASSLNLRGLGPDATLTLLNGTRLPYDGFSQATDASVIPGRGDRAHGGAAGWRLRHLRLGRRRRRGQYHFEA